MSTYEVFSLVVAGGGLLLNVVLFIVVLQQLNALRAQIKDSRDATTLDHARRKKQATIDFYVSTVEKRSAFGDLLPYDRDQAEIASHIKKLGQKNSPRVRATMEYLDLFETLATGVRTDVFDLDVIEGIATGQIRDMARGYWPWIEERRRFLGSRTLYGELENLCESLEQRYAGYQP